MAARRLIVGVLMLAAPLLVGCGDHGSADRKAMENKFERINYEISTYETVTAQYNEAHFEQATRRYIALVREYADTLGPDEARQRLSQKGNELEGYCLPCVTILADETKKY